MKKKSLFILLTVLLMAIAITAVASAAPTNSSVYWWWQNDPDNDIPAGSSTINRTPKGISCTISTSLANNTASYEDAAVTVWFVVFNAPGNCATNPCTGADLGNGATMPDVLYGGGHVIDSSEMAEYGVSLKAGDTSGSLFPQPSAGLKDPQTAEVHYVVRSHGVIGTGRVNDLIQTVDGGCEVELGGATGFDSLSTAEGDCQDLQYSIHQVP